jgi:hypothetical protein
MAESKRFLLRLTLASSRRCDAGAEDDLRSINAQIEYLLTDQVRRGGRLPHPRGRRNVEERGGPADDEEESIGPEEPAATRPR